MNRENAKFMAKIFYGVIIIGIITFFAIRYFNREENGGYNIVEREMTIEVGATQQLNLQSKETDSVNYSDYIFESENDNIASINTEGIITGISNGKTNINIKDLNGDTLLRIALTVGTGVEAKPEPQKQEEPKKEEPAKKQDTTPAPTVELDEPKTTEVTEVLLSTNEHTIEVGKTFYLVATINPSNATDTTVTWTSSNPEVVEVKNGRVNAKKIGIATVTATTSNGKSAQCVVTVMQPQN